MYYTSRRIKLLNIHLLSPVKNPCRGLNYTIVCRVFGGLGIGDVGRHA